MAAATLPEGLLKDVENRLDVTWEDQKTDEKYTELILSAIAYLNLRLGVEADYTIPGEPRTLLMEYVRYARDEALDVFETNYQNRLTAARNNGKVEAYVASALQSEE